MENAEQINALLKQLDAQRDAYLESFRQVHELLAQNLAATATSSTKGTSGGSSTPPKSPLSGHTESRSHRQSVGRAASDNGPRKSSTGLATLTTSSDSRRTGEDSDEDEDELFYVQSTLEPLMHTEETLRKHLQAYKWNRYGAKILETIIDNPSRLVQNPLIPLRKGELEDRSHYSDYQVYDVGPDGAPLQVDRSAMEKEASRAQAIWSAIKEINQPPKERLAVGRITILRELSPILFGAVHHTLSKSFDVDELFRHLVESSGSSADMHRAFSEDPRRQRSFVFNFEYFTIIGKDCRPMKWQLADHQGEHRSHHIPVTRCSSVVALVLNGPAIRKVKNPSRRATQSHGFAYDPWSSWQVLNLQCYPDWQATLDVHDSTKHYLNGPEAFLYTLLGEFRDAHKRLDQIYEEISKMINPPLDFMFDSNIRDKLLFEDKDFTYSRRYFWAHTTLGLMNESIKSMVDAYEETFTDEVWEGTHKTLWPLVDPTSARSAYFKKRMATLRAKFGVEMDNLRKQIVENDERRKEIQGLKEDLFTGTSIQESRKSVENTEITIQQGHNIKLLTLVSIFFLPLTFVTSVFGMTNMPTVHHYWLFGIVTACVCIPFFLLVGSLNTTRGAHFWRRKTGQAFESVGSFFTWLCSCGRKRVRDQETVFDEYEDGGRLQMSRSTSMQNARDMRMRRPTTAHSQNGDISRQSVEVRQASRRGSGGVRPPARSHSSNLVSLLEHERKLRYGPDTYSSDV